MDLETIAGALTEIYSMAGKQLTGTGETDSSAHVVLSDVDLLSEILLRLPVLSILRFKSISKQWLSLIKSTNFITLWRKKNPNLEPPSGLFLQLHNICNHRNRVAYDLVRLDTANKSPLNTDFPFSSVEEGDVEILHSCNGLLLCCIRPFKLFVYNPSTNQFRKLPEEHFLKLDFNVVKLAFDPTKSPHYKVIVGIIYDDDVDNDDDDDDDDDGYSIQIKTYSSEIGDWSVCHERFPTICSFYFNHGIYWNGAIHWLDTQNVDSHYKLDVNHLVLTTIQNPPTVDGKMYYNHKFFESRGYLLLAWNVFTFSTGNEQLDVYEMRNGCCEWSVKFVINIDDIKKLIPKIWDISVKQISVKCIVLGEREDDSFLVLEVSGKIVQYNVVLKTLSKIYDLSPSDFCLQNFPFIPSLAGV